MLADYIRNKNQTRKYCPHICLFKNQFLLPLLTKSVGTYSKASLIKYRALYVGVVSYFNENINVANHLGLDSKL